MSALYNLEPQPTAKVLLSTTAGDILVELFAKQTPLASRSFLQHCLDGYYNDTIFHRLVPGFILQGGDPTGTGEGGESGLEGGQQFEDEFHSRLKWNRRGLLGMANEGQKNTNGSQFFFSLGDCKELEGRNTLFGRIAGDTIYNLLKIADSELGDNDRPLYPTKVTTTEVIVNPFDDLVKRDIKKRAEAPGAKETGSLAKKSKKKAKGGKTLLSFEDEGEGDEPALVTTKNKFNTSLVSAGPDDGKHLQKKAKTASTKKTDPPVEGSGARSKVNGKSIERPISPAEEFPDRNKQLPLPDNEEASRSPSPEPEQVKKMTSLLDRTNAQIADLKASMKRTTHGASESTAKPKSALEQMMPATAVRGKKRKAGETGEDRDTMRLLRTFQQELDAAPAERDEEVEDKTGDVEAATEATADNDHEDGDEAELCDLHFIANCQSCKSWNDAGDAETETLDAKDKTWMSHTLTFEKDRLGKDLTWKRKAEEELIVIDPREKAKSIKDDERARKEARLAGREAFTPGHRGDRR